MKIFVTGGAGFIASNLIDRLLAEGHSVVGYDNFSTGRLEFLAAALKNPKFELVKGDLLDPETMNAAIKGCDFAMHLAANADVRFGPDHPDKDLKINTIGTFNVLEAMRLNGVPKIVFSSTGSIYGEPEVFPTPETAPFPVQTSLYGASKLAGEGLIQAYCESFGMQGYIMRFTSILGHNYQHGHVLDFIKKLKANPKEITVLGDGQQRKSYTDVSDCLDAIMTVISHPQAQAKVNIFNLGTDEFCKVEQSLGWICARLGLDPEVKYTGGTRGWTGDSPMIWLDCTKLRALGWQPRYTIKEGIERTVDYLNTEGKWLLDLA